MADGATDLKIRNEFNRWATAGRGEEMEADHLPITLPVIEMMQIEPLDRIVDLGCGSGWLCRRLAGLVPRGRVVGADLSAQMVRRARALSVGYSNLNFLEGAADKIPCRDGAFTKLISVESAYYWPDPGESIREIFRVLAAKGSAWILINYFRENPHSHQWGSVAKVRTHLLSAEEWEALFRKAGFASVGHRLIPDPTPGPETYTGEWFRDAGQIRDFRQIGALLIYGGKNDYNLS
ncbi:MAG TPA: class I SAM-dependent methyltransferase [Terriglobia bacterium]|nr:class I SAM-dependent methyltransferase [Terriglobia bacterium]